jgi:hypothetical protein
VKDACAHTIIPVINFRLSVTVWAGNFWHNRQMVFDDVGKYMQKCCPGLITDIKIEDEAQLNGFAETSNAFKEREQVCTLKSRLATFFS